MLLALVVIAGFLVVVIAGVQAYRSATERTAVRVVDDLFAIESSAQPDPTLQSDEVCRAPTIAAPAIVAPITGPRRSRTPSKDFPVERTSHGFPAVRVDDALLAAIESSRRDTPRSMGRAPTEPDTRLRAVDWDDPVTVRGGASAVTGARIETENCVRARPRRAAVFVAVRPGIRDELPLPSPRRRLAKGSTGPLPARQAPRAQPLVQADFEDEATTMTLATLVD